MQDWILDVVRDMGPLGVGLLMFVENLFPPLPSEVIMPLAGFLAARQEMGFGDAIAAGTLGSLGGASVWYWLGCGIDRVRLGGWIRTHGIWLAVTPADVEQSAEWFRTRGPSAVLLGRLVPLLRTLISIPAGVHRMPFLRFIVLSALGTLAWNGALAWLGFYLGYRFHLVRGVVGPLVWMAVGAVALLYVARVVRLRRLEREAAREP